MSKADERRARQEATTEQQRVLSEGAKTKADIERTLRPGYEELASTGGVSPEEAAGIRQRASGVVASEYGDLGRKLEQKRDIQGGYAPGYGAQAAELGRDYSESAAETTRDTDIAIDELIRSGKLSGLAGLSGMEGLELESTGLTNQQISNMLGMKAGLATRPGWFRNFLDYMQTAAGVAKAASGAGGL